MIIQDLLSRGLIQPPKWLPANCAYITIMGSQAYGVSSNDSDEDLYGFCFPPKDVVWPHLAGEIPGFGKQIQRFDQWQQHHVMRPDNRKEYDFSIYSIVKYFQLCMDNNPNMVDSLFTPVMCIKHITPVGQLVRDNRKMFLHKGSWHKFRGYAYSQLHKTDLKNKSEAAVAVFNKRVSLGVSSSVSIDDILTEMRRRKLCSPQETTKEQDLGS